MIVGKIEVKSNDLFHHSKSAEEFIAYCDSLVPEDFRHVQAIISNQRYLCCLIFRASQNVDWRVKKDIIDKVMQTTNIVGYTDSLIEVDSLRNFVDMERVEKFKVKR